MEKDKEDDVKKEEPEKVKKDPKAIRGKLNKPADYFD